MNLKSNELQNNFSADSCQPPFHEHDRTRPTTDDDAAKKKYFANFSKFHQLDNSILPQWLCDVNEVRLARSGLTVWQRVQPLFRFILGIFSQNSHHFRFLFRI